MTRPTKKISRRQALKGAAAFPLIVGPHILGRADAAAPSNALNVATIGVGKQGRFNTRNAARAGANIVAICDVDDAQAAEMAKDFPRAKIIKNFRELLEKEKGIDAVMIATPDHSHATIAIAAMEAGKPVYCESSHEPQPEGVPLAVIPLKAEETSVGVIAVYRLLPHKNGFTPVDHQLLELVAEHTPSALLSALLHRLSKAKVKRGA